MGVADFDHVRLDLLGDVIDRPRLRALLDAAMDTPLTSVVAPAGWGKSVLLASWADRRELPWTWIEITRLDNDPGHLIRTLYGGLASQLDSATEFAAGQMEHLSGAAVPDRAEELAQGLRGSVGLAVIVDDVHLLTDPSAVESLQRFVDSIPRGIRLITSARHDPPFPVGRLRVAGRLAEVRQRDLAFSDDEVDALQKVSIPQIKFSIRRKRFILM